MAIALVGVTLVISGGDPASIAQGSVGWGDGLVLLGVVSFVFYTLGAAGHRELSALRYTALTASLGWLTIAGATALAIALGLVPLPSVARRGRRDAGDPLPRGPGRGRSRSIGWNAGVAAHRRRRTWR